MRDRYDRTWRLRSRYEARERRGNAIPLPGTPRLRQKAQPLHEGDSGMEACYRVRVGWDDILLVIGYVGKNGEHYIPPLSLGIRVLLSFPPAYIIGTRLRCGCFRQLLQDRISSL